MFNYQKEKRNFNKKEWIIIQNNMKKDIIISKNKYENLKIKYIRAQNRIKRI